MYLSSDEYRPDTLNWAQDSGLKVFHHKLEPTKEPFTEIDQDGVVTAIEQILGEHPSPASLRVRAPRLTIPLRRLSQPPKYAPSPSSPAFTQLTSPPSQF